MILHIRSMLGRLQSLRHKITLRNPFVVFFGFLFLAGLLFLVLPAHAADFTDYLIRGVGWIMLVLANIAIGLSIFFLRFFIMIASYNNYIDVDVVQLGWIMVRDVANMFFVVALLVIAFGTILGLEEYEWKKNLVKLILAAILINFSNLICQLIIDVAHVFTITFLNAISATAGGNLITMFKLGDITKMAGMENPDNLDIALLAAVIPAMMFAIMAACAIGSYVFVMAVRVVALWALIILSPLAFILGVLPKTKTYAEKWWAEFSKYVIVAPIMVFFLWLSFATLGLGDIATQIQKDLPSGAKLDESLGDKKLTLTMSEVTSWENMASFLIAFAFLMVGIKLTQETGVIGSGVVGGAVDMAKKIGRVATGYAAGRYLAGKAWEGTKTASGFVAKEVGIGLAKRAGVHGYPERIKNWYKTRGAAFDKYANEGAQFGYADKQTKDAEGNDVTADTKLTAEQKAKGLALHKVRNKDGTEEHFIARMEFKKDKNGNPEYKSWNQKRLSRQNEKLIASRKVLEKTEKEGKLNEELMDKRTEGLAASTWGENWGAKKKGFIGKDYDRIKAGMLAGEEARSSDKTREFKAIGYNAVLESKRLKGEGGGAIKFQDAPTVGAQMASHQERAAAHEERGKEILAKAVTAFRGDKKNENILSGKVKAQLEIKAQEAESKQLEEGAMTRVALADVRGTDAFNAAMDAAQARLKGKKGDEYDAEHQKVVQEMVDQGLITSDEADELRNNAKMNAAMEAMGPGMTKEQKVDALADRGDIKEEDKAKILKGLNEKGMLAEVPRENRQNVLARTIESEQAGHLESMRLETAQKKEEEKFALGVHGKAEAREEAVLTEQTAASEEVIKKEKVEAKVEVAEGIGAGTDAEAKKRADQFAAAQAERVAAAKQTELRTSKVTAVEKAAELEYATGDLGAKEQAQLEISKETIAATEAKIKKEDAAVKAEVAEGDGEYKKQLAARIAAEKGTHFEEEKVKLVQKAAEKDFIESEHGVDEARAEAAIHARVSALDSLIKDVENSAKEMLINGEFDQGGQGGKKLKGVDGLIGPDFSYEATVRSQSESDILQKAVGSLETKAKNSAMGQIMADAVIKENEAAKEEFEAGNIHSSEADTVAAEVEKLEVEANALAAEKRNLVNAVQDLLKEKKTRADQVAALEKRIAAEEAKTEKDQVQIDLLKLQKTEAEASVADASLDTGLTAAQTNLNTFNGDTNKGVKLDGLGDQIKTKRIEIEKMDSTNMSDDALDSTLTPENLRRRTEKRTKLQTAQTERGKNSAWRYAEAKALEEVSNINYQGKHNTLLSDVEQVVVHNKRGISTPTTALTTGIEHYGKTYAEMNYDQFVDNMGNSMRMFNERRGKQNKLQTELNTEQAKSGGGDALKIRELQKKIKEVEITEDDKAAYAGLLIKGQKENWIDDGIWRYMQSSMGPEIQKELGWNDQIFDNKKINDIMALFASGADLEFAKVNSYVTDMMDVATEELGLSIDEFLDKLEKGTFTDNEKTTLKKNVAATRDDEYNISTDNAMIDQLLTKDNALVKRYNKTTDDNQAQIQLISGLRDKAAASSHPENGGHGKSIVTKDKKFKDVLIGQKMAESSVLGEVKKLGPGTRVAMQSHASIKIDEANGFSTGTRRKSFRTVRSGATTSNDHRGTNERYMLHMSGLSSGDAKADYATSDGFLVTGKKADGTDSSRFKYIQSGRNSNFRHQKKAFDKAMTDDGGAFTGDGNEIADIDAIERQKVANDVVNNLFADSLLENTPDFLLTMAKMSGVKDQNALNGETNIKIMVHGKERRITHVNDLIDLYNTGAFVWGKGKKPKELIPHYIGGEKPERK